MYGASFFCSLRLVRGQLGQADAAVALLTRAASLDPDNAVVTGRLRALRAATKDAAAVNAHPKNTFVSSRQNPNYLSCVFLCVAPPPEVRSLNPFPLFT